MTPKRNKLFLSSLGIYTASWLFPVHGNVAVASTEVPAEDAHAAKAHIAEEALYRYYHPLSSLAEVRPLKTSKHPLVYEVQNGDTLGEIAKKYETTAEQLAVLNGIVDTNVIEVGKKIKIPYHAKEVRIKKAQLLTEVAKQYNVSKALMDKLNPDLKWSDGNLYAGQVIKVPKRIDIEPPPLAREQLMVKTGSLQLATRTGDRQQERTSTVDERRDTAQVPASNRSFNGTFSWPVGGQITSPFGDGRGHVGIDIWNSAEGQAPIRAAAPGTVTFAGVNNGYGNLVIIDHGSGWSTYYAHLRAIHVSNGQSLAKGEQLGFMGTTGDSTGYHLHFEVRLNGTHLDPLTMLP
ncbi:peptidoglycan DD-metalloendopeptidase family protein [Numidum massiliense]|uniref:peptidoglycan DD-metalloendopeptidase family protein n=1 Tax=Numidum massiliense TaxID=1522315 RepID=UPI0006D53149|nr:M23 family metallopeptidase [Numidum massiliense]